MRLERICTVISLCYFTVFKTTTTLNGEGNGNPFPGEYCAHQILLSGELNGQRSLAGYSPWSLKKVLGPGVLGRPRGIGWRVRWEGGSGWGIHVTLWLIHVNV